MKMKAILGLAVVAALPLHAQDRPVAGAAPVIMQIFPAGQAPEAGPPSNFTGVSTATSRFKATDGSRLYGATVTFEPGSRTRWHSHPLGQLIIVTAGHGWVQAQGESVHAVKAGDVIWTAPGVKHWHGATRTTSMTHVAVSEAVEGKSVTWLEAVTDEQFQGPK